MYAYESILSSILSSIFSIRELFSNGLNQSMKVDFGKSVQKENHNGLDIPTLAVRGEE